MYRCEAFHFFSFSAFHFFSFLFFSFHFIFTFNFKLTWDGPGTREFSQLSQTGKLLLTFLTMVTRWSRPKSTSYVLIGQKLTGEFMRKNYAAS